MARKRTVKEPTPRVSGRTSNLRYCTVNLTKIEENSASNLKSAEKKKKTGRKNEENVVINKSGIKTRSRGNPKKILEEKKLKENNESVVKKKNVSVVKKESKTVKLKSMNLDNEKEKSILPVKRQSKRINELKLVKTNTEKVSKPVKKDIKEAAPTKLDEENKVQRQSRRINKKAESPKPVKKQKQVKILSESTKLNSNEVKIQLRKRKTRNYQDKSLESSQAEEKTEKLPIYQQETVKKPLLKKKLLNDLYEFDSDGEEKAKKRKKYDDDDEFQLPLEKKPKKQKKTPSTKLIINKKNRNKSIQSNKVIPAAKTPEKPVKTLQKLNNKEIIINNNGKVLSNAKTPQKINIINDTVIHAAAATAPEEENIEDIFRIDTPSSFKITKPDANSTMLNHILTPWRFNDINIRRNPHFISIKGSALPNISQEMVIDHTVVEKFDECLKTPRYVNEDDYSPVKPKSSVQKTLTQYFNNSIQDKENVQSVHQQHQISLFGNDELSPIKFNAASLPIAEAAVKAKRRILGDRSNENDAAAEIIQAEKFDGNNVSLFGFGDSSGKEEEEEEANIESNRAKEAKPFRLSINTADRKYQRKKKKDVVDEVKVHVPVEENISSEEEEEECLNSDEEVPSGEVKLFDDLTPPSIKVKENEIIDYNVKVPVKRKRTKAKKPKDKLTKAEKEAADQWAEKFNSMCQEVDEFELEIE